MRSAALGNLKVFVVLLVVWHHTILAYCRTGHFDRLHYLRSSAPIVDARRWVGFDVLMDFNDVWFMSLMFFVSGLFVLPSLSRTGARRYLMDRCTRLGLPFLLATCVIMPVATYPSYLQTGASPAFLQFLAVFFTFHGWAGGPAWFIWVLLAMDGLAVAALAWPALRRHASHVPDAVARRPAVSLGWMIAGCAGAYLPMLSVFGADRWFAWGPFHVQCSRVLLYTVMFGTGVACGAGGVSHLLFGQAGPFARAAYRCVGAGAVVFGALLALQIAALRHVAPFTSPAWQLLGGLLFVVCCVLVGVGMIGVFIRHPGGRWWGVLAPSIFGIYLLHYAPMTWVQAGLLGVALPAVVKACVCFGVTLAASWLIVAAFAELTGYRSGLRYRFRHPSR
jgi:hypothetical protein